MRRPLGGVLRSPLVALPILALWSALLAADVLAQEPATRPSGVSGDADLRGTVEAQRRLLEEQGRAMEALRLRLDCLERRAASGPSADVDAAIAELQRSTEERLRARLAADASPREIYEARCSACHIPRDPARHSTETLERFFRRYAARAGIRAEERPVVLAYLRANAKDAPEAAAVASRPRGG